VRFAVMQSVGASATQCHVVDDIILHGRTGKKFLSRESQLCCDLSARLGTS